MQSRKSYQAFARAVENLVREQFPNGSSNRIEDQFNIKKYKIALAETHQRYEEITETSLDLTDNETERFAYYYAICKKYTSGNCQTQASWAMAQYIKADVHPVYLVLIEKHQMIIVGDYINHPETAFIHDPHGHEIYPYQELALGGHHANRYSDTLKIKIVLKKDEHWNQAKRSEFVNDQCELMPLKIKDEKEIPDQPKMLRNKQYWDAKVTALGKTGIAAFKAKKWDIAINAFQKAMTLTINNYGEKNHRLEHIFYNLASAYFEKDQFAEAHFFFNKLNNMLVENFMQSLKPNTFGESYLLGQTLSRLKCSIKLASIDLEMGNIDSAIQLYKVSILIASDSRLKDHEQAKTYKELAEFQLELLKKRDQAKQPTSI